MALIALEVIGFIAMCPTVLYKDAYFGQRFCHMQQVFEQRWCVFSEFIIAADLIAVPVPGMAMDSSLPVGESPVSA